MSRVVNQFAIAANYGIGTWKDDYVWQHLKIVFAIIL